MCFFFFFLFLSCLCGYKLVSVYLNGWLFHHNPWNLVENQTAHTASYFFVQTAALPTEQASAASQGVKEIRGPGRSERSSCLGRISNEPIIIPVIFMARGVAAHRNGAEVSHACGLIDFPAEKVIVCSSSPVQFSLSRYSLLFNTVSHESVPLQRNYSSTYKISH